LALAREAVGADVAEGCLHRVGLGVAALPLGPLTAVAPVLAALLALTAGIAALAWLAGWLPRASRLAFPVVAARRIAIAAATVAALAATARLAFAIAFALGRPGVSVWTRSLHKRADIALVQFHPGAALQPPRQHHRAVADADQPADGVAQCLEQPPDLAVAAFGNRH